MAHRLVQQHAGPARAHHHRQGSGRCRHRFQVHQGLAQGFAGIAHGAIFLQEIAVIGTPAAAMATTLAPTVLLDDHAHVEPHQRADIRAQAAVAGGDQDAFPDPGHAHGDLLDTRVQGTGGSVDALQQLDLLGAADHVQRAAGIVQPGHLGTDEGLHATFLPGPGNGARGARGLTQGIGGDGVAVGEAGLLAGLGAHADALVEVEAAFLDDAVLQHPGLGNLPLEVQVGGIYAGTGEFAEDRRQLLDAEVTGRQQVLADG
ncbi:hypothetical protein D9M71_349830 [compost metagenome]